jgi:hypothetical protein
MPWHPGEALKVAGSFDLDYMPAPLSAPALAVAVYAYTDGGYQLIPNVVPVRVDRREGPEPSAARFRYLFDDAMSAAYGWPNSFAEVFGLVSANPYVVLPDQRLVIAAANPDGSPWVLWDGFAQVQQAGVEGTAGRQAAGFTGVGIEARLWDMPISGRIQRDADPAGLPDTSGNSDVATDLRPRFNPADTDVGPRGGSLPNATGPGMETNDPETGNQYPVFVDPGLERSPDPRAYWSVGMAVRYLLATENGAETWVVNPPFGSIDATLQTYQPAEGYDAIDPTDPASYTFGPLQVPDFDAANHELPEALTALLGYTGFAFRFETFAGVDGSPQTALALYRRDQWATAAPKSVYLTPGMIDPTVNNARDIELSMDMNAVVNAYQVETGQRRVEVSWILAPLYRPVSTDAQAANRRAYRLGNLSGQPADVGRKYRWYGADECGDGHWTIAGGGTWSTLPCDFTPVFPDDSDGSPSWVTRYRPGSKTLASTDTDGRPMRADLSISFDYTGKAGAPWDGSSGTWQSIRGGWRLLPDRLGIEVTCEDPEQWAAGRASAIGGGAELIPGGAIRGITWWAAPPAGPPTNGAVPTLRLTTVIEDDLRMPISAGPRISSPTAYARWRIADRRDMFQYCSVDPSSMNYASQGGIAPTPGATSNPIVVRDDTKAADALAAQLRSRREAPTIAGSITIPYLTDYYQVGDRIDGVSGSGLSLQTNLAAAQGEAPTYPWIVGVSWVFDPVQETHLILSDRHALPDRR